MLYLGRGNCRGLKWTDQVLKVADEIQFGFMPGCGTANSIFVLKQLLEKYIAKKRNLYFPFVDLEKAFDWVP